LFLCDHTALYCITTAPDFHEKSENIHPKICWFFHETQWFFEVFGINGTGLYSEFFEIPEAGGSLTRDFLKYAELAIP
jgi:hypothetical protein